ncbi:uncharacterized protein MONBRDRAFT_37741 [Monosiga brevicollis MX1]|uniref:Pan3 C-terminal knob domain-containing protein n=1 Tax=Monosiga brevicollis TaxID=81824 RepID=A9V3S3_MONBE|nr:uncharacterized protein MONBRDRAFT_37741 [Monosiga brevicollis MX1]EDQ87756.1 predicted protein [Monosiga brevicollis MX1]|eukprot:XP_001747289.1 hypothetical protein [Monosiga brevicollis MX1]
MSSAAPAFVPQNFNPPGHVQSATSAAPAPASQHQAAHYGYGAHGEMPSGMPYMPPDQHHMMPGMSPHITGHSPSMMPFDPMAAHGMTDPDSLSAFAHANQTLQPSEPVRYVHSLGSMGMPYVAPHPRPNGSYFVGFDLKRVYGVASVVYKATSREDGRPCCLRRLANFHMKHAQAMRRVEHWRKLLGAWLVVGAAAHEAGYFAGYGLHSSQFFARRCCADSVCFVNSPSPSPEGLMYVSHGPTFLPMSRYLMNPGFKTAAELMPMVGTRFFGMLDQQQKYAPALERMRCYVDVLESDLAKEMYNGHLFRLLSKLNTVVDRPEQAQWQESGDTYMLRLFKHYMFHQAQPVSGAPFVDLAHVVQCLSKLDAQSPEIIALTTVDAKNVMLASYAELAKALDLNFTQLVKAEEAVSHG